MHFLHEKQDSRSDSLVGVLAKLELLSCCEAVPGCRLWLVDLASQLFLGSVEVLVDREVDLDVVGVLDDTLHIAQSRAAYTTPCLNSRFLR